MRSPFSICQTWPRVSTASTAVRDKPAAFRAKRTRPAKVASKAGVRRLGPFMTPTVVVTSTVVNLESYETVDSRRNAMQYGDVPKTTLEERLQLAAAKKGWTVSRLSVESKCNKGQIDKMITRHGKGAGPSVEVMRRIASTADVDFTWLCLGIGEMGHFLSDVEDDPYPERAKALAVMREAGYSVDSLRLTREIVLDSSTPRPTYAEWIARVVEISRFLSGASFGPASRKDEAP